MTSTGDIPSNSRRFPNHRCADSRSLQWTYTGSKTRKETGQACGEFGINAAKTIKDTIAKLEKYVNDNELWEEEESQVWGTLA